MLEILLLAGMCYWVNQKARKKGRREGPFIALAAGLLVGLDSLGFLLGFHVWGSISLAYLLSLGGAVLGGVIGVVAVSCVKPAEGFVTPGQAPCGAVHQSRQWPGQPPYQPYLPYYSTLQPQQPYVPASLAPRETSEEAAGGLACPGCATLNQPDSSFCYRCGKPLGDQS